MKIYKIKAVIDYEEYNHVFLKDNFYTKLSDAKEVCKNLNIDLINEEIEILYAELKNIVEMHYKYGFSCPDISKRKECIKWYFDAKRKIKNGENVELDWKHLCDGWFVIEEINVSE